MESINHPHKRMFVGREVSVCGVTGIIAKETKRTFIIQTPQGTKTIPKRGKVFVIDGHTVKGDRIMLRHEDRLKV